MIKSYILRLDEQFCTLSGLLTWSVFAQDINPISSSSRVTREDLMRTLVTLFKYLMRGPFFYNLYLFSICHQLSSWYLGLDREISHQKNGIHRKKPP